MGNATNTQIYINQLQQDRFVANAHGNAAALSSLESQRAQREAETEAEAAKQQAAKAKSEALGNQAQLVGAVNLINKTVAIANETAEIAKDNERIARETIAKLKAAKSEKDAVEKELAEAKEKIQYQQQQMASTNDDRVRQAEEQVEKTQEYYKNLLCKPFAEIASENTDFKATYEKQQQILTDWIMSQSAFKGLAKKLANDQNMSEEQWSENLGKAKEVVNSIGLDTVKEMSSNDIAKKLHI